MEDHLKLAMKRFLEARSLLETFSSKEEAVDYLAKKTGISRDECAAAYDILIRMDAGRLTLAEKHEAF